MQPTMDGQDLRRSQTVIRPGIEKTEENAAQNGPVRPTTTPAAEVVSRSDDKAVRAQIKELSAYFKRSYHLLYGQALGLVASPEIAEDVVQEAFTNTSERIEAGTRIKNMNSWLRCCVQNISIKHLRRKPTLPLQEELEIGGYTLPADLAHTRQRFEDVCRAIDRLAPAQKSAFILAEIRGMAHRDIADAMNRSEGSVRQLISRARNRIREKTRPTTFSMALPLFIASAAEARCGISRKVQYRIARAKVLTMVGESKVATWQVLRSVGKPAPAMTMAAMSAVMVVALGSFTPGNLTSTEGVSPGLSSVPPSSSTTKAKEAVTAEAMQDESTSSSSGVPTAGRSGVNLPAASNGAGGSSAGGPSGESSGTHSDGTYGLGTVDFSMGESQENTGGDVQGPVAIIASPNDDRLKKSVVKPTKPPRPIKPPVIPDPPELINPAVLSGTPQVGMTVSCTGDTWSNEPTEILKRWRRNGRTFGPTGDSYTLELEDATNRIDCYVTAENAGGTGVAVTDTMVPIGAPVIVTPPSIVGGTHVGDVVRCTGESYSGYPGTATYDWRLNGESLGRDRQMMYLYGAWADSDLECVVTATNVVGSDTAISESIHVTRPGISG